MWLSLPVELQRQCLEALDVSTLKSFRLVSRPISWLATELLFSTLSLQPCDESAENIRHVVENEKLRLLVRTIVFNTSDDPYGSLYEEQGASPKPNFDFEQCLEKMTCFDNLREVRLKFARLCATPGHWPSLFGLEVVENIEFRTRILRQTFRPLAKAIREGELTFFDTLTIKNLQDHVAPEIYTSEDFATVLGKVRKLHLCIASEISESSPEDNIDFPGCHDMFNDDLVEHWLAPVKQQLTHLSLYATDCRWGFWPFCDLRGTHFPNLRSLSLGNHTIALEWQIDWILSHADTLKELYLDDCPIICVAKMAKEEVAPHWPDLEPIQATYHDTIDIHFKEFDLRWHQIFTRFRTGLPNLRHFAIGKGDLYEMQKFEERYELLSRLLGDRYYVFDILNEPSQWIGGGREYAARCEPIYGKNGVELSFPECDAEDYGALVALLELVISRALTC